MNNQDVEMLAAISQFAGQAAMKADKANAKDCVIVPSDSKLVALPFGKERPDKIDCLVEFDELDDFIDYVNLNASESSIVFTNVASCQDGMGFHAVLDFHRFGSSGLPDWCSKRAEFRLQYTEEWNMLRSAFDQGLNQEQFASLVEDLSYIVLKPKASILSEIALTLEGTTKGSFKNAMNLHDGKQRLEYSFDVEAKAGQDGSLEIPREVSVSCPMFKGSEPETFVLHLRFRIRDGKPYFFLRCAMLDKLTRDCEDKLRDILKGRIETAKVYNGQILSNKTD